MYLVEHVSSPTCRQSQRGNDVSYPSLDRRTLDTHLGQIGSQSKTLRYDLSLACDDGRDDSFGLCAA